MATPTTGYDPSEHWRSEVQRFQCPQPLRRSPNKSTRYQQCFISQLISDFREVRFAYGRGVAQGNRATNIGVARKLTSEQLRHLYENESFVQSKRPNAY